MSTPHDADYKKQQRDLAARAQSGFQLEPTIHNRINRLNPAERDEVKRIINSMKLRKIIRKTLAEAFWATRGGMVVMGGQGPCDVMQRLRNAAVTSQPLEEYAKIGPQLEIQPTLTTSGESQHGLTDTEGRPLTT